MISLGHRGLLSSSRSRRSTDGIAKAPLCMRKPGLIQIFILAEGDVFPVFTFPTRFSLRCWRAHALLRSSRRCRYSYFREGSAAATNPASGVGAVTTVTSQRQRRLAVLSEDIKKHPPPPPQISPERCPWQRKASRAYSNSIDTSRPPTHPLPSVCPPQSRCDEAFIRPPPPQESPSN